MVSLRLDEFIESKALIIYADVTRAILTTTHNFSIFLRITTCLCGKITVELIFVKLC